MARPHAPRTRNERLRERLVGTYLHGPALPRNPALADRLLGWVVGRELERLEDRLVDQLRRERLAAGSVTGWRARLQDLRLNRG